AWLTAGQGHNDPVRFARSLASRVARAARLELSANIAMRDMDSVLTRAAARGPLAIILDDFDVIAADEALSFAASLLHQLPENVRLFVACRSDPRLPLARRRARGEVLTLRERDLRLRGDAIARIIALHAPRCSLYAEQVSTATAGWPLGVRMIARAVALGASATAILQTREALLEEVFQRESEAVTRALQRAVIISSLDPRMSRA